MEAVCINPQGHGRCTSEVLGCNTTTIWKSGTVSTKKEIAQGGEKGKDVVQMLLERLRGKKTMSKSISLPRLNLLEKVPCHFAGAPGIFRF